jgi:DNA (cytosine-5)-methyltransferase 1
MRKRNTARNAAIKALKKKKRFISMYKIPTVEEIKNIPKKDIKIISLFAGGGGSSTGYRMAGGSVLLANEFVHLAADTYSANWPDTIILKEDIRTLNPLEVLEVIGLKPKELDLLDGSPPCCGFSISGIREKGWGKLREYSDTKQNNVEELFFEYIRFLKAIQPKVFIAENVAGLVKGASKGYFNIFLRGLEEAGYYVEVKLVNSAYLGVPQRRERVIFVGIRNDLMKWGYQGKLHPKPVNNFVSLEEAFKTLKYDNNEVDKLVEGIKRQKVYKTLIELDYKKHDFNLYKANPKLPAVTLMATLGVSQKCLKHWDNRPLTIGELKRIQSLPDDYILLGSYIKQAERIGRMVPPLVSKALLENLIKIGIIGNDFR